MLNKLSLAVPRNYTEKGMENTWLLRIWCKELNLLIQTLILNKVCISFHSFSNHYLFILQQTLNNQELSSADVERMKHEKKELQKAIEQQERERDYFNQQIWEKEMQFAKKHEEVSKQQGIQFEICR